MLDDTQTELSKSEPSMKTVVIQQSNEDEKKSNNQQTLPKDQKKQLNHQQEQKQSTHQQAKKANNQQPQIQLGKVKETKKIRKIQKPNSSTIKTSLKTYSSENVVKNVFVPPDVEKIIKLDRSDDKQKCTNDTNVDGFVDCLVNSLQVQQEIIT